MEPLPALIKNLRPRHPKIDPSDSTKPVSKACNEEVPMLLKNLRPRQAKAPWDASKVKVVESSEISNSSEKVDEPAAIEEPQEVDEPTAEITQEEDSLLARVSTMIETNQAFPEANPPADSGIVKPLVFGGLDGIITTFAVIAGAVGAQLSFVAVIAMGLANLIADAFSMGLGELTSSSAEHEYELGKQALKSKQVEEDPAHNELLLVKLYMDKGLEAEHACQLASVLRKYPEVHTDTLLIEELGIMPPEQDSDSVKQGGVMFGAFIMFGAVPLVAFAVAVKVLGAGNFSTELTMMRSFMVSCLFTAVTLMALGAVKAKFTEQPVIKSAFKMLGIGCISGLAAFGVGEGLSKMIEHAMGGNQAQTSGSA